MTPQSVDLVGCSASNFADSAKCFSHILVTVPLLESPKNPHKSLIWKRIGAGVPPGLQIQ
jgi:hypothetical protein